MQEKTGNKTYFAAQVYDLRFSAFPSYHFSSNQTENAHTHTTEVQIPITLYNLYKLIAIKNKNSHCKP